MDIFVPSDLGTGPDREYRVLGQVVANLSYPLDHVIVEIGALYGKATVTMAKVSRHRIISIDPHSGPWSAPTGQNRRAKEGDTYDRFIANLERYSVRDRVEPLRLRSDEVKWDGRPICLLFIDGSHDYTDVRYDLAYFSQFVVPGGLIVFHDYGIGCHGVNAVADQACLTGFINRLTCVGIMLFTQKPLNGVPPLGSDA